MVWDPSLYLTFEDHRNRPATELAARIPLTAPKRIVDLGCGPGNSTRLLAERWPDAEIIGVDNSDEMLDSARKSGVNATWIKDDVAKWTPDGPVDCIFSSAALHWAGDHFSLFPKLLSYIAPGGALAVQMPYNFPAPSHRLIHAVAIGKKWSVDLNAVRDPYPVSEAKEYYSWLREAGAKVDIWHTEYLHVLQGQDAVFRWVSGSTMTPYIAALPKAEADEFAEACRARLAAAYPPTPHGETLYAFTRLFIVALKT
ncbi:MAG: methyltransferase domain-containing protein [Pseudomonadota bacterium]